MKIRDIISLIEEASRPLFEMPVMVGDEDFALTDPDVNHFEYQRLMRQGGKVLWQKEHIKLREHQAGSIENEIFLADEVDEKVLFYVNYDLENIEHLGKAACQRVLWRDPQLGVYRNVAKKVFFDVLLNRYGTVISDTSHTAAGKSFWQACMREAASKGLTVGVIDTHTGASRILPSGEDVDEWLRDIHPWSPDAAFAEIRLFITKKALTEDFTVPPRETLGTKVIAYSCAAFQKDRNHPRGTGVWFTSDPKVAEAAVQQGVKRLIWDPRVVTAEIELGSVKQYKNYQEFLADFRKAGSDGAWYRRMLRRQRYHSIEIAGENGSKVWAVMGNWQIKIKDVKNLNEAEEFIAEETNGLSGSEARFVRKLKDYAAKLGITAEFSSSKKRSSVILTDLEAFPTGQGKGTKFMEKLCELADEYHISVYTMADMSRNRDFFRRFDFDDDASGFYLVRRPALPSWFPASMIE